MICPHWHTHNQYLYKWKVSLSVVCRQPRGPGLDSTSPGHRLSDLVEKHTQHWQAIQCSLSRNNIVVLSNYCGIYTVQQHQTVWRRPEFVFWHLLPTRFRFIETKHIYKQMWLCEEKFTCIWLKKTGGLKLSIMRGLSVIKFKFWAQNKRHLL